MHEENGLIYALDKLYHLRKEIKTIMVGGKVNGPAAVRNFLPKILFLRDQALLAPCPSPENRQRCMEYRQAVRKLSSSLDDLAISVINKQGPETAAVLSGLLEVINQTYGFAL